MKKLLLSLTVCILAAVNVQAEDIYVIGSNVNGKSWSLAQADCKFTQTGPDTYEWTGSVLGTGFKFNNGTWSNDKMNWGSNGQQLVLGQPYRCTAGGSSGNIPLADVTEVSNPKIVMTYDGTNPPTIVVTGEGAGEAQWYVAGFNGQFVAGEDYGAIVLWPTDQDGVFESDPFDVTIPTGEFKIASTGWATEYGLYDNPPTLTLSNMEFTLEEVAGEAGNIPYELPLGSYSCRFDLNALTVAFTQISGGGDIDYSSWYVNIVGPFNEWTDNGVNPVDGIATIQGLNINEGGFKVKVYNGASDLYYITGNDSPIALDQWVKLSFDSTDGSPVYIAGANSETVYDVQYNVATNEVMVTLVSGESSGGGDDNVDYSSWYVNVIGPFNDWTDNGANPVNGISTHFGLNINADGFKVKVYNGSDMYYITGTDTPIPTDQWIQLYLDTMDGPRVYIEGAGADTSYDVMYNCATNQIMVMTAGGVDDITVDNTAAPVYYNLQGMRLNNPAPGQLIIVRCGDKVSKQIVR